MTLEQHRRYWIKVAIKKRLVQTAVFYYRLCQQAR